MAKSMIKNTVGSKKLSVYVPCGSTEAQAFADAVLDGTTDVYQQESVAGSDIVDTARDVRVMIQDETSGSKDYLNFLIKSTKHEGDVISALVGKTFNGVKADKVVVISMTSRAF